MESKPRRPGPSLRYHIRRPIFQLVHAASQQTPCHSYGRPPNLAVSFSPLYSFVVECCSLARSYTVTAFFAMWLHLISSPPLLSSRRLPRFPETSRKRRVVFRSASFLRSFVPFRPRSVAIAKRGASMLFSSFFFFPPPTDCSKGEKKKKHI